MRPLVVLACLAVLSATLLGAATAAEPSGGTLSVESGKGVVVLDLRGSILGRLSSGTLRVADQTPFDRFTATVVGRRVTQERLGPRTVVYRGQGLRFRMLGGGYRIVVRGFGIDLSAVGKGVAVLDGEPKALFDDVGLYSLDGVDCGLQPERCLPLPLEPTRFVLGPADESRSSGKVSP
jgi:hypothetical protein